MKPIHRTLFGTASRRAGWMLALWGAGPIFLSAGILPTSLIFAGGHEVARAADVPAAAVAAPALPPYTAKGDPVVIDGWLTAQNAATLDMAVPEAQDILVFRGKAGTSRTGMTINLIGADGATVPLGVQAADLRLHSGVGNDKPSPDWNLGLTWPGKWPDNRGTYFVRPNLDIYSDARRREILKEADNLPRASETPWRLELRRTSGRTQYWFNGQFMAEVALSYPLKGIQVKMGQGSALAQVSGEASAITATGEDTLALPVANYPRAGVLSAGQIQLAPNASLPAGLKLVPNPAGAGAGGIDLGGLGRIPARADDLVSFTWRRNAMDSLAEARLFSVPAQGYSHIYVLCAAQPDPAKTPSFTVRVTRYGRSRGDALADTVVQIPASTAEAGKDARVVGTVQLGEGAAKQNVPLWLIRAPLAMGLIADLLTADTSKSSNMGTSRYLEVEFMDPVVNSQEDKQFPPVAEGRRQTYWPGSTRSSVQLYGAALERPGAWLDARTNTGMNIFYAAEKPEYQLDVMARRPGAYTVAWDIADVDGKIVGQGKRAVTAARAGENIPVSLPLTQGNGWYATRFRLTDNAGEELVDLRSAFVMLPPDTRKAGLESPYGTWWFHWAHGGAPDIEKVGPVLQRAGLHHTTLPDTLPESITKKYGVTAWNIPWKVSLKPTMAEMMAAHEEHIRKHLALWPSLNKMKVWHESGSMGAPFPSELWGKEPPPLDETAKKNWQFRVEYVTALARMVREKFPGLKIQYGNDGNSLSTIAGLLRTGFPREYIDTIATEDLGQAIVPERAIVDSLQSLWFLRQTARKLGYNDVPVTASHEWMNRRSYAVGMRNQAEWQIRDALHALAYGLDTIALGSVHDAGTGYFFSLWGGGGLTRRYPVMEPKPIYAAVATHTRVLDGARFEREVPTAAVSPYVLEFKRGTEWVYALWMPRGSRELTLRFPGAAERINTDLYGREKTLDGTSVALTASTAPQYLASRDRVQSVDVGAVKFAINPAVKNAFIVDAMDKADKWAMEEGPKWMENSRSVPNTTQGNFELREVQDEEMGACLELELKPKQLRWEAEHEFIMLKLKEPVKGPGPYKHGGLWVKGNGGSGDIRFLVQGSKTSYIAQGATNLWNGNSSVNFEGWNYVGYPMGRDARWGTNGTITGLIITMPQHVLHLTEMKKVPSLKIRLKNLSVY